MAIDRNDTTLISHWSRNGEVQTKLYLPAKNEAEKPGLLVFGRVDGSGVLQAPGCMWMDSAGNIRKHTDFPTDENSSGTVLGTGSTTFIGLTDVSPANFTGAANKFVRVNAAANALEFDTVTGDVTVAADGTTAIASGVVVNDDINSSAAIAFTKLATLTRGSVLIGNSSNQAAAVNAKTDGYILIGDDTDLNSVVVSGDIAITNTGVTSISAGVIVNNDVNASAAIVESKIAFNTSTGHNHDGIGSKLVSAGIASNLANNVVCEAGGTDYTLAFGTAGGAYTLTVPAVGGGRTFAFINEAQSWAANQTIPDSNLLIVDNGDATKILKFECSGITTSTTRTVTLPDASGTMTLLGNTSTGSGSVVLATSPTLVTPTLGAATATTVNKLTLTQPANGSVLTIADGKTITVSNTLTLAGTDGTTMTFPSANGNVVTADSTSVFTGKSLDCDGTNNALTNVNATELDPVTITGATIFAIPYCLFVVNGGASTVNVTLPFKSRIILAHALATKGCGGNWKLNDAAAGGGNDITTTVSYGVDQTISMVAKIDDARHEIAAGTISLVNSDNTDTAIVTIWCVRVD